MHSSRELGSAMFAFAVDGRRATLADIFPDLDPHDRLGIVARTPGGALGASALIMATITAFYDRERARATPFFRYPDYFIFHTGTSVGPYGMLDIWPEHKELALGDAPSESLLRAINDRAITRLLIEDGPPGEPHFARDTLGSVGLRDALAFAPGGQAAESDVAVTGNPVTERYVDEVIGALRDLTEPRRADLRATRAALLRDGNPVEHYRRLTSARALALLAAPVPSAAG